LKIAVAEIQAQLVAAAAVSVEDPVVAREAQLLVQNSQ
jgi:hypothetical protein